MKSLPHRTLIAAALLCCAAGSHAGENAWLSAASFSLGQNSGSSNADVYRIGVQKEWRHNWFSEGAWYLGGYWDTELALMQADQGADDKIYGISLTPVFRYQRDARLSSGVTPFAEAGIGAHLLSGTHLGNSDLATTFQFGSLLGVGVGFGERGQYELSYRYTHISNADIKQPNDGVDLHLFKLGYNFY